MHPRLQLGFGVLTHRPVDDGRLVPTAQVVGEVVGRIKGGQERKRSLRRIAITLFENVVEDHAVRVQRPQPTQGQFRDPPQVVRVCGCLGWRDPEEKEISLTRTQPLYEIHWPTLACQPGEALPGAVSIDDP